MTPFQRLFSTHLDGYWKRHWEGYQALTRMEQAEYRRFFADCTGNTLQDAERYSFRYMAEQAKLAGL